MNWILLLSILIGAQISIAAPLDLKNRVFAQKENLTARIQTDLKKKTGFNTLKQFKVKFDQMECHETDPSEMEPVPVGVCFVSLGAFQVHAKYALILGNQNQIEVMNLFFEVE